MPDGEPIFKDPESLPEKSSFRGREGKPLFSLKTLATHGVTSNVYTVHYLSGEPAVVKNLKIDPHLTYLRSFKNEAAILRRLEQFGVPGVPRLHNAVINETTSANTYLVMDLAVGVTNPFEIRDAIRNEHPLLQREASALKITKAVAETITRAYRAGVDYVDAKGQLMGNLIVNPKDLTVTIIDWGEAKLGEPKNDSNALAVPWASTQLESLVGINGVYDREGRLTVEASEILTKLSPRSRNILAKVFSTGYHSGDELIYDLDEALQHISDPFSPASIEEIKQLFPQKEKTVEEQFREQCQKRITNIQRDPSIPEALKRTVHNLGGTFYELLELPPSGWYEVRSSIEAIDDPAALPEHIRTGVYEPIKFMVEYRKKLRAQPDNPRKKQQLAALGLPQSSAIAEYLLFGKDTRTESLKEIQKFFAGNMATIRENGLIVPQVLKQFIPLDEIGVD